MINTIAFDSPLRGANVPMGIQFMIKDLATRQAVVKIRLGLVTFSYSFKIAQYIPKIASLQGLLTAPASKQMLFYNAFTPTGNPREFHDAFYAQLAALGDLKVDYSVVSNGSTINQPQLLNPGELYVGIKGAGTAGVLPPWWHQIDVRVGLDLKAFALPSSGSGNVYTGNIVIRLPFTWNLPSIARIDVNSQLNSTVTNLKPLDSAPGGFENFGFPKLASGLSFGNIVPKIDFGTKTKGLWCFVPTFSALDIPESTNVNQNFDCTNSKANRCVGSISADAFSEDIGTIGGTAHNQDHVSINQRNATFLLNQLAGGAGLNNLTGSLTRTYNFGISNQTPSQTIFQPTSTPNVMTRGLTVEGTGKLWVNRSGKINFTDENNLLNSSNSTFNLSIRAGAPACVAGNTSVIVQNSGTMQLGDASVNNIGTVHIEKDATLDMRSGGTLQIEGTSQLIVENGGKLILNAGAIVNLVALESKIIIKNGGELIINGSFTYSGTGYFSFEAGNKLTLNSDWVLRGVDRNTRLINVENNASITVNEGRRWTIQNALVRKVGITSNDVLVFNNGATFFAENVTFDDRVVSGSNSFVIAKNAIDLDNNPDDMDYSFRNCSFANTSYGIWIEGADQTNRFDFPNINVEIINTTFTKCSLAYIAEHGYITVIDGCTITGGGIDIQRMYWLQMRNTTMRGGSANSTNNTIGVKLTFSIHNWIRGNNIISDYGTGIDASHGSLHSMNGNIILSDRTTIQSCKTAIKQDGGPDYGLLYMDCTQILENASGITGTDILLSAYSRGNTANIYTRPHSSPGGLFFKNTFDERRETDIWLFGSYWDNAQPTETTINGFWQFWQNNAPWQGTMHVRDIATTNDVNNCGGITLRDAPTDSLVLANPIVQVNNEYRNVRIQQDAALSQLKQNNLAQAIALFEPVAAIINGVRDTANAAVRHFVDVARTMAMGTNGVTIRSKSNGWLPETLVEVPKKIDNNQLMVYPNPANTSVQMELKKGNYNLRVSNAIGQTIFAQNVIARNEATEGVLSVNVATWTNGIYLFELTDKTTNKRQHSKIVIQH